VHLFGHDISNLKSNNPLQHTNYPRMYTNFSDTLNRYFKLATTKSKMPPELCGILAKINKALKFCKCLK
jgi:hypothetical protein